MEKQIWKYPLAIRDEQKIMMPREAEILTVQEQKGVLCLWAVCPVTGPIETRILRIYGMGHLLPDDPGEYIATVQQQNLVWHIFEMKQ